MPAEGELVLAARPGQVGLQACLKVSSLVFPP